MIEVFVVDEFDVTDGHIFIDRSDPYISAEKAMKDLPYRHLDWKYISTTKFDGTIMERWEAVSETQDGKYLYNLEAVYVIGSDD